MAGEASTLGSAILEQDTDRADYHPAAPGGGPGDTNVGIAYPLLEAYLSGTAV